MGSPHGEAQGDPEQAFERFYVAQLLWDEAMAQGVAAALKGSGAPSRLLVLAGVGHVGPHAVPARARRRGVASYLTVVSARTGERPEGAEAADLLVDSER